LRFARKNQPKKFFREAIFHPRRAAQRGAESAAHAPFLSYNDGMAIVLLLIVLVWLLCGGGIIRANRHYSHLEDQKRRGFEVIVKPRGPGKSE
jgi:hypothetical protein